MVAYSANKLLAEPTVTGDSGVWGTYLNDNTILPVDRMLGGILPISLSATNYTLSATDIQYITIKLSGVLLTDIIVYSSNVGLYIVENNTTGAHTVTWMATSAPSGGTPVGSGIVLVQGSRTLLTADLTVGARRADSGEGVIPAGSVTMFFQAAAPVGWTQVTTYNNYTLRIVNGAGGGVYSAGQAFSAAVCAGTVAGHTLTAAEMPVHAHGVNDPGHAHGVYWHATVGGGSSYAIGAGSSASVDTTTSVGTGISIQNAGSGGSHAHGFTGSALNINYVDAILCQRN